jgi:hypothetical protein
MIGVPAANNPRRDPQGRSVLVSHRCSDSLPRVSRAARLTQFVLLAIGAYLCCSLALWAQTPDSQTGDSTRTIEGHIQSGNRTLDTQSVQHRGPDGHYEPDQDIEKETVQVDATTVRTITRTFDRNADGVKTLVQVTEEEKLTLPGGASNIVRTTSNADGNGNLQLAQREMEETKKISPDVEETKTTLMLRNVNGGLAPAMKLQERRTRSANDTIQSQRTTLLPDSGGNWRVSEIRQATTKQDGQNRSSEERVSQPDSEGKLGEVSRTVSKESAGNPGETRKTVETYSVYVPGSTSDGSVHLVERATTVQHTSSTGHQTTEQQVEQPSPGDPGSGLQVTILTTDTVTPGPSGAQATRTIRARNANGSFGVVSVDTTKSDNTNSIQVQIAPSEKPK